MDTKKIRQKILDLAIHGKLVPQDPNDEPASVLLERIRAEKERLVKEGKIKKSKAAKTSDTPHYENVPFEIPSSWEWTTLGEVSNYGDNRNIQVENIGHTDWVLELEDIEKDSGNIVQYINKSERKINGTRHKFSSGDILYSKLRTYLNKVLIAPNSGYCTTEIIPFGTYGILSNEYICHILRSPYFLDYTIQCGYGVKMPRLSTTDACNGMIPIPPYSEQQRIVAEIEKWFALIDIIENGKTDLQTTIKQTKSKILDLAIHGKLVPQDPSDEPASELLKRINPKAEITCDNGHYGKEAFELPNTWVCCRLGDVISIKSGDSISVRNNRKGEYPIYGGNGINGYFCDYNVESDTIVIGRVGFYCGSIYKTKSKAWVTDNAFIVCYKKNFNSTYLKYVLEWLQLSKTSNSTAQPVISGKGIYPLLIPLPPLTEQQRIVYAIDTTFAKLDAIMESL